MDADERFNSDGADEDYISDEELYKIFLGDVLSGRSLNKYDIEDLIVIYDYASDHSDALVMSEAMNTGLQRFHNNQRLLERRALHFLDHGYSDAALIAARRLPPASFIRKLITLQVTSPELRGENSLRALLDKIRKRSLLEQDAISLVDYASDMDALGALGQDFKRVSMLMKEPESFMTDLAHVLSEHELYPEAHAVLNELITLEPFNNSHWLLMAQTCDALNDSEGAASAIEYSLAIDPRCKQANIMKAGIMFDSDAEFDEIYKILLPYLQGEDADPSALLVYASALTAKNDIDGAVCAYTRLLPNASNPEEVFNRLLALTRGNLPDNAKTLLRDYLGTLSLRLRLEWAIRVSSEIGAAASMTILDQITPSDDDASECHEYMRIRFGQMYQTALTTSDTVTMQQLAMEMGQWLEGLSDSDIDPESLLVYACARVHAGSADHDLEQCVEAKLRQMCRETTNATSPTATIFNIGLAALGKSVLKAIRSGRPDDLITL